MISKGDEARMVLYDYDFENGSAKLTCRGTEQIKKIARMVPENFYSVRVAPARNCNEDLDVKRRDAVWKELSRLVAIPAERVITDRAPSRGLAGREAIKVEANLLRATEAKGNIVGAGGSLTGLGSASSAR
jgi:hypothetical protein